MTDPEFDLRGWIFELRRLGTSKRGLVQLTIKDRKPFTCSLFGMEVSLKMALRHIWEGDDRISPYEPRSADGDSST